MTMENSFNDTNVDVVVSGLHKDMWVIRDIYDRILTGELLDPADACELLHLHLEDGELNNLPTGLASAFEVDTDESVEMVVRSLWNAAHDTALAWNAEYTDTDRFYEALMALGDDSMIDVMLFSSLFDSDPRPGQRGVVAIAADAWRYFNDSAPAPITVLVDSRQPEVLISEISLETAEVFEAAGLAATVNADLTLTITAQWRHHVLPFKEAQEAAALIPRV